MVPAVTAEQMRAIDRIITEDTGPNLFATMESAGRDLATHVIAFLGASWRDHQIVVLAGVGGNGGAGLVAARHLANRGGEVVAVVTEESRMRQVPGQQLVTYRYTPGRLVDPGDVDSLAPALILDALVGYNLSGPPRDALHDLIAWSGEAEAPVISVDIPSGLDATSGEAPGVFVAAAQTLTFALPKTGLGPSAGKLWLGDVGVPLLAYQRVGLDVPPTVFGDGYVVALQPS